MLLSFPVIVDKFLSLAAGESAQIINLMNGGNVGVRYHGFERCFPGMEERGISIERVGVALWKVLPSQSGNYLFINGG